MNTLVTMGAAPRPQAEVLGLRADAESAETREGAPGLFGTVLGALNESARPEAPASLGRDRPTGGDTTEASGPAEESGPMAFLAAVAGAAARPAGNTPARDTLLTLVARALPESVAAPQARNARSTPEAFARESAFPAEDASSEGLPANLEPTNLEPAKLELVGPEPGAAGLGLPTQQPATSAPPEAAASADEPRSPTARLQAVLPGLVSASPATSDAAAPSARSVQTVSEPRPRIAILAQETHFAPVTPRLARSAPTGTETASVSPWRPAAVARAVPEPAFSATTPPAPALARPGAVETSAGPAAMQGTPMTGPVAIAAADGGSPPAPPALVTPSTGRASVTGAALQGAPLRSTTPANPADRVAVEAARSEAVILTGAPLASDAGEIPALARSVSFEPMVSQATGPAATPMVHAGTVSTPAPRAADVGPASRADRIAPAATQPTFGDVRPAGEGPFVPLPGNRAARLHPDVPAPTPGPPSLPSAAVPVLSDPAALAFATPPLEPGSPTVALGAAAPLTGAPSMDRLRPVPPSSRAEANDGIRTDARAAQPAGPATPHPVVEASEGLPVAAPLVRTATPPGPFVAGATAPASNLLLAEPRPVAPLVPEGTALPGRPMAPEPLQSASEMRRNLPAAGGSAPLSSGVTAGTPPVGATGARFDGAAPLSPTLTEAAQSAAPVIEGVVPPAAPPAGPVPQTLRAAQPLTARAAETANPGETADVVPDAAPAVAVEPIRVEPVVSSALSGTPVGTPARQVAEAVTAALPPPPAAAQPGRPEADSPLRILTLQLRPMDLGTVLVRMRLRGGQLEMTLQASREETAALLRQDGELLTNLLRGAGYQPEAVTIGSGPQEAFTPTGSGPGFTPGDGQQNPQGRPLSGEPERRPAPAREAQSQDAREWTNETNPAGAERSGVYL